MLTTHDNIHPDLSSNPPDDLDESLSDHYLDGGYVIGGDPGRCCFCRQLSQAHLPVYAHEVVPGEALPATIRANIETIVLPFCFSCIEASKQDLRAGAASWVREELLELFDRNTAHQ